MVNHAPARSDRVSETRLWFGLCAGAAAWATHGLLSVVITSEACLENVGSVSAGGVRLLLAAITLGLLLLSAAGLLTAYRSWRTLSAERNLIHASAPGRQEYMALLGVVVNSVFLLALLWAGLPLLLLDVCNKAR